VHHEPLSEIDEKQLELALDEALSRDDVKIVLQVVDEMEKRGQTLVV
jgi:hypothetical protein